MEVNERLLRVILTHLGFIKAYDDRCKPLLNSLIARQLNEDTLERSVIIVEMLKIEEYYVQTFFRDTCYDTQNDRAKHLLIHFLLTMKSSLEEKIKFFREILDKLKLQAIEQKRIEFIFQLRDLETKLPEIQD